MFRLGYRISWDCYLFKLMAHKDEYEVVRHFADPAFLNIATSAIYGGGTCFESGPAGCAWERVLWAQAVIT
jgi:hypothetical protein